MKSHVLCMPAHVNTSFNGNAQKRLINWFGLIGAVILFMKTRIKLSLCSTQDHQLFTFSCKWYHYMRPSLFSSCSSTLWELSKIIGKQLKIHFLVFKFTFLALRFITPLTSQLPAPLSLPICFDHYTHDV